MIFKTATDWVALLADQQRQGRLDDELKRLERYPLLICDLCRYRDYADIAAAAGLNAMCYLGFLPVMPASVSA